MLLPSAGSGRAQSLIIALSKKWRRPADSALLEGFGQHIICSTGVSCPSAHIHTPSACRSPLQFFTICHKSAAKLRCCRVGPFMDVCQLQYALSG